ncbi:MAG TPA: HlyC/CorC family transporter [Gammaproteobacteria bacterium]|nr:HlyC/CorC family transporter [Gammaproteobacteria bacterium]
MDNIPLGLLYGLLAGLLFLSAFFAASETAIMSINRYRLKHKVEAGHRGAMLVSKMLEQPDQLLGLILMFSTLANNLAAVMAAFIVLQLFAGASGPWLSTIPVTIVMLIFCEITPKTFGALHPELIAYPAAYIFTFLLKISYPFVWIFNVLSNGILNLLRIRPKGKSQTSLSPEELSTVVRESGSMIPKRHKKMLLNILSLEGATVEDIMVPRNEVVGIDLDADWESIREQLNHLNHTRIPVYREKIDHIVGILHVKRVLRLFAEHEFDKESLENSLVSPYFVPEGTTLAKQLLNFQKRKRRMALVVDEYGDLLGLITLEDILEEIVGQFTTDSSASKDIHPQPDGSFLADASVHIRDLNRALHCSFPTDGPKTLNGMILEYLEMIPEPGTSLLLHGMPVEIIKTRNNAVKTVRLYPEKRPVETAKEGA